MINPGKPFNIHDYLEILLRRRWYIIIPFVVILTASIVYAFSTPKEYRARALILVTPQKVPEGFVKPTITSKIEDRLHSITQEIMSRGTLEKVISEFKLYQEEIKASSLEEVVELMRKNIGIEIHGKEGYFAVSFIGKDPKVVAMVTNKLTSLFTEENLKIREQQAQGTSEFLFMELNTTKAKLDEQENLLTKFKRQFMGELPEQREANIRVLEQLQTHYQRINENIRSAQDRKVVIQKQLSDLEIIIASLSRRGDSSAKETREEASSQPPYLFSPWLAPSSPQSQSQPNLQARDPLEVQLGRLKDYLNELEFKYTAKHPDIILTKKMIKDLEPKVEKARMEREAERKRLEGEKKEDLSAQSRVSPSLPPRRESPRENMDDRIEKQELERLSLRHKDMENQLIATDLEIERLKEEEVKFKGQMGRYRERIENTPLREQGMAYLFRDYQNTKIAYQTLMDKYEDARRAENLERRQKGEQFKVIESAQVPGKPFKPDIPKILLFGLMLALGGGLGTAFLVEQMDRSFRDASDIETTLSLKVIANIPKVKKEPVAQST